MAAMNRSEMGAGGANPGANLNLDDDSLFAELDSEVMMGEEPPGGGDLDFDLDLGGDAAPAAEPSDDLDLDLGGDSLPAPGEPGELDLDLGMDVAAAGGGDDLDLDLGGDGTAGAGMDDLDLDLGEAPSPAGKAGAARADAGFGGDDLGGLDLDFDAGTGMDLELGGTEVAPDDMGTELDLGAPAAPSGDPDLDLDLDLDESLDLTGGAEESEALAAGELGDMDLELGLIAEEEESAPPASGGDELESLDLALDEPFLQPEPEMEAALAPTDNGLGLDSLSIEPLDLPDEPVFDMAAISAPAAAESEFHAAEDVPLDDEAVHLELQDVDMEPIEDEALPVDDMIALEPAMRADNAVDLGPMAGTASEFVAVPDTSVADEDLLELNLDDLDAATPAQEAPMMRAQSQAASKPQPALDATLSATDLLEIPPEVPAIEPLEMEPLPDFDIMEDMSAALMPEQMAAPRPMPAMRPSPVTQGPAPAIQTAAPGSLLGNDILMAVSHQISVQLGSLSLNGKELLDISYGSVLPLERVIGEPVDLVLENKTIAQAEVVLINGKNLGVRIVALNR